MTTLNQSFETIMSQPPEWIYRQLTIEKRKTQEDKPEPMTRKELVTMIGGARGFDRLQKLKETERGNRTTNY